MKRIFLLLLIVSLAITSAGCVHRRLTIKSDPPGATVYFNDEKIGKTPVDFDFMWYHDGHLVRLEKEGYETLESRESIKCPLHLWMPFDLIAEIMPVKVEDYREFSYELIPETVEEIPAR